MHIRNIVLTLTGLALALHIGACTARRDAAAPESDAQGAVLRDIRPSLGFDTTGAACAGRLYRDTAHSVSGTSECRNGHYVFFSGHSDSTLAADLSCDYALYYTAATQGTGRLACTDGSTGTFTFLETGGGHGIATARMQDGREIMLDYKQTP